jgi:hypothetical protein
MRAKVLWCLMVLSIAASTAIGSDGTLNWAYQPTGFQAGSFGSGPQTALAMRDGRTWPVIFSPSLTGPGISAYSLYPVLNPSMTMMQPTYWHQVGSNLLYSSSGSDSILSAATSSDGRVGAVARYNDYFADQSAAVIGGSRIGFGAAMSGVRAIDFDSQGNLVKGTANTIPMTLFSGRLVDIAVSPMGDLGAIDDQGYYYQKMSWTGSWGRFAGLQPTVHADLAMDSLGRPHVVSQSPSTGGLIASDFDVMGGTWTSQILASSISSIYFGATVAADSRGNIGAAWVQDVGGAFAVEYAQKGKDGWFTHEVTTGVYNPWYGGCDSVASQQRVGLAFDANDFPVISFVAGSGNIWLAYDPPSTVPEPCSLMLLATGAVVTLLIAGKSRLRRLLGK